MVRTVYGVVFDMLWFGVLAFVAYTFYRSMRLAPSSLPSIPVRRVRDDMPEFRDADRK